MSQLISNIARYVALALAATTLLAIAISVANDAESVSLYLDQPNEDASFLLSENNDT
jgi:hypothetical protein